MCTDIRKELDAWKPLKDGDSKSPCACGCIYIVTGTQRTATITSSPQCYSLPIVWKVKVYLQFLYVMLHLQPNNLFIEETFGVITLNMIFQVPNNKFISATLDLIEFSCLNSVLKIRDPTKGNEIIHIEKYTIEKLKMVSSMHNKTKWNTKHVPSHYHHEDKKMVNKKENVLKSGGQFLILEYLAPRRSCRVNIKITAFAKGK